ncbi:Disease resistance protein RBA1 [Cardamine amara subsp. amara]|uniref:Disease resistance protein RBA1 n=1 Tax=Cardamine amara subsp. amara TaxID=228776 RepID=A0ABD0ZP49_CARAN
MVKFMTKIRRTLSVRKIKVFINYRGEELRTNFVSHLIVALERYGINFFIDINEQRGKDFEDLFVRIEESSIALTIFSPGFAESELVKIAERSKLVNKEKLQVIPIFYKVEPEDVKGQKNHFGANFNALTTRVSNEEKARKWKHALELICDKMGLLLRDHSSEADFIEKIVVEVQKVRRSIVYEEEETYYGKNKRKVCPEDDEHFDAKRRKTKNIFSSVLRIFSFCKN